MAVYKVVKGEVEKVGETLESLVRADLANWENFDEDLMYKGLGFVRYDEEDDVYSIYRRSETDRPADELPERVAVPLYHRPAARRRSRPVRKYPHRQSAGCC